MLNAIKSIETLIKSISPTKLKGKDRYETAENYSIAGLVTGVVMLSLGLGLNIVSTKGLPTILAMMGALVSFSFTVILILVWLLKEILGKE